MSWNDFYRRQGILDAVESAARGQDGGVPFDAVAGASDEFAAREDLLRAMHHRWSQLLSGHLRTELSRAKDGEHADAVARAWHNAVAARPALREIIAGNLDSVPGLRAMHETDLRMLAIAAELAEPDEPAAELTEIGAAFLTLTTQNPAPRARRRNPAQQLVRMLSPAS